MTIPLLDTRNGGRSEVLGLGFEKLDRDVFDPAGMRTVPQNLYSNFPAGVHTMYIGRIVQALRR